MGQQTSFDKRHVRKNFHRAAESYSAESEIQRISADRVLQLARSAVTSEPDWVLDAGCGTGYCAANLQDMFPEAHIVAFDIAHGMAQQAARKGIMGLCGDLEHLPVEPRSMDLIVTNGVVHWCNDLGRALRSFHQALKPGGTLLVVDHSAAAGAGLAAANSVHRMDRDAAIAALEAAGFTREAESALYMRPDDPRTANVFDPAIRGKTDQFVLRLRKRG